MKSFPLHLLGLPWECGSCGNSMRLTAGMVIENVELRNFRNAWLRHSRDSIVLTYGIPVAPWLAFQIVPGRSGNPMQ